MAEAVGSASLSLTLEGEDDVDRAAPIGAILRGVPCPSELVFRFPSFRRRRSAVRRRARSQAQACKRRNKKTPRIASRRFSVNEDDGLLALGLFEHAIDLLVRGIAAGLARLGSLQRLVGSALSAVSSGTRGLGGSSSGISSGFRGGCILHSLLGRGTNLINRLLRHAAAGRNEGHSSNTCLQCGGDGFLHDFFPLHTGSDKKGPERLIFTASEIRGTYGLFPRISPQKLFNCKSFRARAERGGYKIGAVR